MINNDLAKTGVRTKLTDDSRMNFGMNDMRCDVQVNDLVGKCLTSHEKCAIEDSKKNKRN